MSRFIWKVITPEGLDNLEGYGYHGVDNSFFGNLILNRFWNWCVEQVPMWIAPNVLTLMGLICNLLAYLVIAVYTPNLVEAAPRWAYFVCAFLIFMYQVLDNVDGKQARRTRSSSPLGELFDHGCDALSVALFALLGGGTLRVGTTTFWLLIAGFLPFYLAHWEEYHTGSLILGKFNGPTEAQLVIITVLVITGMAGPWIWVVEVGGTGFFSGLIPLIFTISAATFTMVQNVMNVLRRPSTEVPVALRQLIPIVIFTILSVIWFLTIPATGAQFHFSMNILGVIFSYLVSRLIVNRICREPVIMFHWILIPFAIETFIVLLLAITDYGKVSDIDTSEAMMWILFILSSAVYLYFAVSVVLQLATHLGIRVFRIPYPPPPPPEPATTSVIDDNDTVLTGNTHIKCFNLLEDPSPND